MHPSPVCLLPAVLDTPGASGSQGLPRHKCSAGLAVPKHLTSMSDTTSLSVPGPVIAVCTYDTSMWPPNLCKTSLENGGQAMLSVGHTDWKERRPSTERSLTKTKLTCLDGWGVNQKQEPLPMAA